MFLTILARKTLISLILIFFSQAQISIWTIILQLLADQQVAVCFAGWLAGRRKTRP